MNTKFGICIPTYNRKDKLQRLLTNITPQLEHYDIPIFISDNNSTDGTFEMIENFKRTKYKNIIVSKNNGSPTYASNYLNALSLANTEYIWYLSDDDDIFDYTIETIMKSLVDDIDFLICPYAGYDQTLTKLVENYKFVVPHNKEIGLLETIINNIRGAGFLSFVITKREYLIRTLKRQNLDLENPYLQLLLWAYAELENHKRMKGNGFDFPWSNVGFFYERNFYISRFKLSFEERSIYYELSKNTNNKDIIKRYDGTLQINIIKGALFWKKIEDLKFHDVKKTINDYYGVTPFAKVVVYFISLIPKCVTDKFYNWTKLVISRIVLDNNSTDPAS